MKEPIHIHHYDNGLVLIAEEMDWLESAAFTLALPAGCVHDHAGRQGLANFLCEMVQRGCGDRGSREFMEALDALGVDRTASVSSTHTSFGAASLADNLYDSLSLHGDLVRKPHLPAEQLEEARQVCLHELRAIEDDLAQRVMLRLRQEHYPDPWGRPSHGTLNDVLSITREDVEGFHHRFYSPHGAILSVAGKIDWPRLRDHVGNTFGDWQGENQQPIMEGETGRAYSHIAYDSSQTHIGVAYPNVPYGHRDYYQARGAVGVLSDGMSSRLFTEVRENRGLCYTVYAMCHSLKDRGSVMCYAGTSTDRARETLDVVIAELDRLADGITTAELDRLKARIKSGLIMQQESSASRSSSMAGDWYFLQRVQTLDELGKIVDGLTSDSINAYLKVNRPSDFTVVTLGEEELEVNLAVS